MSILADLAAAIPTRLATVAIVGSIFCLLYFSIDIFLFFTKRQFGRVNVEVLHFTKHDFEKRSDALHLEIIKESVCLRQAYGNRLLFWWVIFRSVRATFENPVVTFWRFSYAALSPFRGYVAEKCAIAVFKRALGYPYKQERYKLVMVYDGSRNKRRRILKILVIRQKDLKIFASYLENPPKTAKNLRLFEAAAQAFAEKKKAFLTVRITVA